MLKMIFKEIKKIIGMYFGTKSYLKSNCYHTAKHTLRRRQSNKNLGLKRFVFYVISGLSNVVAHMMIIKDLYDR
jgi:hypothetical protein